MSKTLRTTKLWVELPERWDDIAAHRHLYRFKLPRAFASLKRSDKHAYPRLYGELNEHLPFPYKDFAYDGTPAGSIYVLARGGEEPENLTPECLNGETLIPEAVAFGALKSHVVMKLFLADYFRSDPNAFRAKGKYLLRAKVTRSLKTITCLEVELQGDKANDEGLDEHAFILSGRALRLIPTNYDRLKPWQRITEPIFGNAAPKEGQMVLRPVKRGELATFEGQLYRPYTDKETRARLDYHHARDIDGTRGKLLYDLCDGFTRYLQGLGLATRQMRYDFVEFESRETSSLPLHELGTVSVLDNRIHKEGVPVTHYVSLFESVSRSGADVRFALTDVDPSSPEVPKRPLLVLHDSEKAAHQKGGPLHGLSDPYQNLYRRTQGVAKQSLNVNPNEVIEGGDTAAYLNYPAMSGEALKHKIRVCLSELYLKDIVVNCKDATHLPGLEEELAPGVRLVDCAFIRARTRNGENNKTLLHFPDGKPQFLDLRDPGERFEAEGLLKDFGLDWSDDVLEPFKEKTWQRKKSDSELKDYVFVVGPDLVLEIETLDENVLYDYDTIAKRVAERQRPFPVDSFRLSPFYNQVRNAGMPALPEDVREGVALDLLSGVPLARTFYQRLLSFDQYLDEMKRYRREVSLNELTSGESRERLAHIFGTHKTLYKYYQKLGRFESPKKPDTHTFQGIWHDGLVYTVGSWQSLNDKQAGAHRLRRVNVYRGGPVRMEALLQTLAVTFVRHKQYTVYPHPFHLIDLYETSVLAFN